MINYVFAAEFDILKGCVLSGNYPTLPAEINETYLSTYMVPDGQHKVYSYLIRPDFNVNIDCL